MGSTRKDISNGQFIIGNSQKEVHQTRMNDRGGHSLRWSAKEIWPSYEIESIVDSLYFKINSGGGLQGDTNISNGKPYSTSAKEDLEDETISGNYYSFDPYGGVGSISFICRQTSYWHKVPLILRTTEKTNISEDTCINLINATNDPEKETKDETTNTLIREWTIYPNNYDNDNSYVDYDSKKDFTLDFTIGSNNNDKSSLGKLEIIGFIDSLGDIIYFNDLKIDNIVSFQWYQKPNVSFYVDMDFVQKPTSVSSDPIKATNMTFVNQYNKKKFELYLFVEFGISVDGGQNIYWNQDSLKISNRISTKVPLQAMSNPNFNIVTELSGENANKFENKVQIIQLFDDSDYQFHDIYYKYFKITLNAKSENNEQTNTEVTQEYYIDKKETNNTAPEGIEENGKAIAYWTSKKSKPISKIDFILRRKSKTNPWICNMSASLLYTTDKLKYIGSTDPNKK